MTLYMYSLFEAEAPYAEGGQALFDEVMAAHQAFSAAVRAAGGTVVAGEALREIRTASFFRDSGAGIRVIDNPMPETTEVLGGFYVCDLPNDAVAAALAPLCPAKFGYVELRPVWDMSES